MHELRAELLVPKPIEEVFPFFAKAENLERITPEKLSFNIATPTPITMREGLLIDYKLKLNGIPMKWKSRIPKWEPPHQFVDDQVKGPYKVWHHTHGFEDLGEQTRVTDTVLFQLPLEPFSLVVWPMIRAQLKGIFTHRQKIIRKEFGMPEAEDAVTIIF